VQRDDGISLPARMYLAMLLGWTLRRGIDALAGLVCWTGGCLRGMHGVGETKRYLRMLLARRVSGLMFRLVLLCVVLVAVRVSS
jgi:hypothetical protein